MLYHYRKGAFCVNQSTKGIPKKGLPEGFLYVDEVIEDCIVDAKYAGTDNFMGRPAEGYTVPLVVVTKEAAERLVKVAAIFREKGYLMKFYDSYRPQRAVDDFVRWGLDVEDDRRKTHPLPKRRESADFRAWLYCAPFRPYARLCSGFDARGSDDYAGARHGKHI